MMPFGFGYYNPTASLYDDDPLEEERRRRLAGLSLPSMTREPSTMSRVDYPHGFLMPKTYGGRVLSQDEAGRARGAGISAFGAALLQGALKGDIGAGFSEGVSDFSRAMGGSLENDRRLTQENEEIERRRKQEEDRQRNSDLEYEERVDRLAEFHDQQERGKKLRVATGKSASEMVREIEGVLGKDSPEASHARALATLGEDADLNRLSNLWDDALKRSRQDTDARHAMGLKFEEKSLLETTPGEIADRARADRSLGIQSRALDLRTDRATGAGMPTAGQRHDDILSEADRIYNTRKAAADEAWKNVATHLVDGKLRTAPYDEATLLKWRQEAEDEATKKVDAMYASTPGRTGAATGDSSAAEARLLRLLPTLPPKVREQVTIDLGTMSAQEILDELPPSVVAPPPSKSSTSFGAPAGPGQTPPDPGDHPRMALPAADATLSVPPLRGGLGEVLGSFLDQPAGRGDRTPAQERTRSQLALLMQRRPNMSEREFQMARDLVATGASIDQMIAYLDAYVASHGGQ